jgi:DNA-binding CsgD family transcriptional regulator
MTQEERNGLLEATLNTLAAGVFVVAGDGSILHMNRFAVALIEASEVLSCVRGRLVPLDRDAATQLARALARLTDAAPVGEGDIALALPRRGGRGLVATLMRLPGGLSGEAGPVSAVTMIVQDPARAPRLPTEAFASLYCLTQAEIKVAMALIPSGTPQAAAAKLGISCNTVKTHLQRIFEKTATSRQTDLVALMLRATPPVTA